LVGNAVGKYLENEKGAAALTVVIRDLPYDYLLLPAQI
jgi:hypothetical protein